MEKFKINFSFFLVFIGGLLSIIGVLFLRVLNAYDKKFDNNDSDHRRMHKRIDDVKSKVDVMSGERKND